MEDINFKQIMYREIASFVSALGDSRRIEILEMLCQCDRNVESLADLLGQKISIISHHLQILKRARLVEDRKSGRFIYYSITDTGLALWNTVTKIASREIAEVKLALAQIFTEDRDLETYDYGEIARKVAAGEAVLIDVRPEDEYLNAHLPGAVSIPLEQLHRKTAELPKNKQIFAYCRGRYCVLSHEAVKALNEEGFNAFRLETGMAEYKAEAL